MSVAVLAAVFAMTGCATGDDSGGSARLGARTAVASDAEESAGRMREVLGAPAGTVSTDSTARALFRHVMEAADAGGLASEEIGHVMQRVGSLFVGSSYVGGLLDASEEEKLIVSLDKFDCVLFVETVLALSQGIVAGDESFDGFVARLGRLRYRGGTMDGYCSRLHYFSEWIHDNEARGMVHNVTLALGGIRADGSLDFMSSNRSLYARFAKNDSLFAGVVAMEDSIAHLDRWYIPQQVIRSVYPQLRAGDIVAISTTVEGLDVSHSGLVYEHPDGRRGLLHASTQDGVTIADDLADYVLGNSATHGIVVARPVDPRLMYD